MNLTDFHVTVKVGREWVHADEEALWLRSSTENDLATQVKVPGAGMSLRGKISACCEQGPGLRPSALRQKQAAPKHQRTDSPLKRTLTKIITPEVTVSLSPSPPRVGEGGQEGGRVRENRITG